jgi:hypothetical protein
MRIPVLMLFCALLSGCVFPKPGPGLSLNAANVVEGPVLIERSGHVYLRYRRGIAKRGFTPLACVFHKETRDSFFFYFSVPVSHTEWGNLIELPLGYYEREEMARNGRVFWLDPDGSTHTIPLRKEDSNSSH